jgi:uncharacterized protein YdeI (YjbR/CyaY-like superfamily)
MNPKINEFFDELTKWKSELQVLRTYVLDCLLLEEVKWKVPCYTHNGKNIVLIHGFKDYYALLFMKGALLQDSESILIQQTENVQSGRQIRFTSIEQLVAMEATIKAYIFEAMEVEKAGLKIEHKKKEAYDVPYELIEKFNQDPTFKTAFEALTPGRQKGYLLHFSGSNNSKTRTNRIEKYMDKILQGKGMTDCTCGLSKRMPICDGSHKFANL